MNSRPRQQIIGLSTGAHSVDPLYSRTVSQRQAGRAHGQDEGRIRLAISEICEGFRMPAAFETAPLVRRPASESLQRRKPRWGDAGWCRVIELSRVKQPSDDQEGRLWGFNVWRHLYFQGLDRSKYTTLHNLNVSSAIFESHEAN